MKKLIKNLNKDLVVTWLIALGFITLTVILFSSCQKVTERRNLQLPDESHLVPTRAQYDFDRSTSSAKGGKPGRPTKPDPVPDPVPVPTPTPITQDEAVIFYNFNGKMITNDGNNNDWIYYHPTQQPFYCEPSVLNQAGKDVVIADAVKSFADYKVTITTDKSVFDNATGWKQEVVITPTKWYGGYSGVSFIGSGSYSYHPVNFVFETSLFDYPDYVGKIATHETGHAAGLRHQSTYNADCTLYSSYAEGAKMGVHWSTEGLWIYGTSYGCNIYQDDKAVLTQTFGLK